jgi:hypothetical protein
MTDKIFNCPHCEESLDKEANIDVRFDHERIQGSDDTNADPRSEIDTRIELWYCLWCGKYFRVYYTISLITKLMEE